jgi:hypothetical protein
VNNITTIAETTIEKKIYLIRGKKVMLDQDLAHLYGVPTMVFMRTVRRNAVRFPSDFMYVLTRHGFRALISQSVISKTGRGGRTKIPHVFKHNGVAMLSGVLRSKRAVLVNVKIMRALTRLRELLANHQDLREKINEMEVKYDHQFQVVFQAIKKLIEPPRKLRGGLDSNRSRVKGERIIE